MNYAEKELSEAMAYLEQARNTFDALRAIQRALELGQPVEVSFRTATHSVAALCPGKASEKLLEKLLDQAFSRQTELEKQEVYWVKELAAVHRQQEINTALRDNPNDSLADFQQREFEHNAAAHGARQDYLAAQRGKAHVSPPFAGFGPAAPASVESTPEA